MKNLGHIYTDKVELELIECECGFHIAVDSTYLEQVCRRVDITCPSCSLLIECGDVLEQGDDS